jgi:hypothetical protein
MAHPIKNSGMQVRGKAIVVIPGFIKKNFGEEGLIYWLSKITPEARHIYESKIDGNKWYSLKTVLIEPTANIAHLFYNWNLKSAAWELGRYSADNRFGGISKLLIKFPCESRIVENSDGLSILHITCFPEMDSTTEFRIGGWIQRGLEINGCKNLQVNITKSLTRFDAYTEYQINWQSRGKSN